MRETFPAVRRAAVVLIALLSVVGAAFLVWRLGTPEGMSQLSTAQLAGMVALFLLPGAALAAWELDRRACVRRLAEQGGPEESAVHLHEAESREPEAGHRHRVMRAEQERVGR